MSEPSPRFLLLETSGRTGWVAVAEGPCLLASRTLDETRRHARDLAPTVAELLHEQKIKFASVSAVIVSRGPGSYTGLRVGLMSAKTFAYATRCVLLGIDTFAAIARQSPPRCGLVDVIADAQKDLIYVQSYSRLGETWQAVDELRIQPFSEWQARRSPEAWVSGPGMSKWSDRLPGDVKCVPLEARGPTVSSVLASGLSRFQAGESDDIFALEPLYLRASSAEQQWRERSGR